jgi:hypothetical protein
MLASMTAEDSAVMFFHWQPSLTVPEIAFVLN